MSFRPDRFLKPVRSKSSINTLKVNQMGHIKEPTGVDLVINSRPLTKEEETAVSEYIRAYKAKHSHKQIQT
jgi:hypothetical protein